MILPDSVSIPDVWKVAGNLNYSQFYYFNLYKKLDSAPPSGGICSPSGAVRTVRSAPEGPTGNLDIQTS